jgi:hypothetical protein
MSEFTGIAGSDLKFHTEKVIEPSEVNLKVSRAKINIPQYFEWS